MNDAVKPADEIPADQQNPVGAAIVSGLFLTFIGFFIALVSFIPSFIDSTLMKHGASVEGTVTQAEEQSSRGSDQEVSTISYIVDGKEYSLEEKHAIDEWSGFVPTEEGTKVTVYYNADKPKKAVAEGWEKSAVVGYVAGGACGVLALFVVVGTVIKSKRDGVKAE